MEASFSEQQTISANLAIDAFRRNMISWVILLAQMQSGKTETYLFIACELIRCSLVENVVVFSGNAEVDLREQLKDQVKVGSRFFEKYQKTLLNIELTKMQTAMQGRQIDFLQFSVEYERVRVRVQEEVKASLSKIRVVWGSELNSYSGPTTNTLFIWEEAHYAQSREQRPDKFLRAIGVSADGNDTHLQRNSNLMLTISATPFSELSDNLRQDQGKFIVKMLPGDGYVSVKEIRDSGRIVPFTKKEDGIANALDLPKHGKNWYGIIRFSHKDEKMIKSTIELHGWKWVVYDSVSTDRAERKKGEDTWKSMNQEPEQNTVILIRGKCRMGKNLEKKHLLFVFETAKSSKTDTVLQSLLGRTCGYSEGSDRVIVYLSSKIVKSGEIELYIEMWERDGVQIMPTCANNLVDKKVKEHVPIIPIEIRRSNNKNERKEILNDVKVAFSTGERIVNKNSSTAFDEVRNKVLTFNSSKLNCRYLTSKEHHLTRAKNIHEAFEMSIPRDFGSGGCVDENEIKIWVNDGSPEFDANIIYVTSIVSREDMETVNIPATTGREVFATRLEDGTETFGNGGMTIRLSSHTANNVTAMKKEICNMIDISQRTPGCDKKIASCWDDNEKEFKGILVTPEIYKQLQKGGSIYEHAKSEYEVCLHTCKSSGPQPKNIVARGFIKLASISW